MTAMLSIFTLEYIIFLAASGLKQNWTIWLMNKRKKKKKRNTTVYITLKNQDNIYFFQ